MGGPTFTLQKPWEQGSVFGDRFKLKLDPEIQAELDAMRFRLQISQLRAQWMKPDWSQLDPLMYGPLVPMPQSLSPVVPGPLKPPSKPGFCSYKPGKPPTKPRKGETADVLKAVWALPCVQHAADQVSSHAERQWGRLGTGEKALVIGHTVVIGGGLVAGIASDNEARVWVLDKLSGVDVPVPKLDGVTFRIHAPKGILSGGGVGYSNKAFEFSADAQQKTAGSGQRYNDLSFSLKINVLEAIPPLKKVF